MPEFKFDAGTPVLIDLAGESSAEWLTVGRYANGWQFTRNGLLLWIERGELDQMVRPAPMPEPTEWGAKITDDDGDWLRTVGYRNDRTALPWLSSAGTRRRWDEMRNPRPYEE